VNDRFLIFALARTGSTTLMRLLRCHPDIRCIGEPFNKVLHGGEYWQRASDEVALDEILQQIWGTHNGIKHVWYPEGGPFRDHGALNAHLLSQGEYRILFLTRRNALRRLISLQISEQTGVWVFDTKDDKQKFREIELRPINADSLRAELANERETVACYRKLLALSGKCYQLLYYEDLFAADIPFVQKLEQLNKILTFLGRSSITNPAVIVSIERLFDSTRWLMNSEPTYRRIPAIEQIEHELGSNDTGWLFDRG
jgi:LPS sulfotransferase NodH